MGKAFEDVEGLLQKLLGTKESAKKFIRLMTEHYKRLLIGIDGGVNTGFAVYNPISGKFVEIKTYKIHRAFEAVLEYAKNCDSLTVYFEDARQRKWFGNTGREKLQGAGSAKRDSKIWEDFLCDKRIKNVAVAPKNNTTKIKDVNYFKALTGYKGVTSEHGRDAAMLVIGRD